MKFERFRVTNYRNILDSGWIQLNQVTAFVGQNEAGKSNLFEALYRIYPVEAAEKYSIAEDWPVDKWDSSDTAKGKTVCVAEFSLGPEKISELYVSCAVTPASDTEAPPALPAELPRQVLIHASRAYEEPTQFKIASPATTGLDSAKVTKWCKDHLPKFVYIHDYEYAGVQVELDQLRAQLSRVSGNRAQLTNEEQTILVILDLAKINLEDFFIKGQTAEGRTVRSFDKRSASAYLSKQFQDLWRQKDVQFDIEIDGTTLNIFARDAKVGMPVRLNRRSTGFRWYVSFSWKFTHATHGLYKNCILLLEEPGIHLHYDGQRDLLKVFERLSSSNTILYSTHLASMVDLANPERVRIIESQDSHTKVMHGVVSSQKAPMAVIEFCLGLTGDMSGLLGNRQTVIVEGGDDALILYKLSGMLRNESGEGLSDRIYLWPARGASQIPMYAAFAIGHKWDAGVLLDSDPAGTEAKKKIEELYLSKLTESEQKRFRVMMLGNVAGIKKTDSAIEDLFPDEFYLECVNSAFALGVKMSDLPLDGSDMITKRVEEVLVKSHGRKELDKRRVFAEMLKKFDQWTKLSHLPPGTEDKARKLFKAINAAFGS
jgi:energy-coupling factor transporter ATP-binding protein EcfA2